ncbi:phosphorylated adapter RNA export-like protein [Rhynchospora pubera]|uniref:Phosphorylated adapter RNA export protein n=1 Tax=Rhynchospora pubera TaxID=906938 RepID=A0AAV8HYR0_9POAL|nr:phosphorylated adapter RNA export-like protein [Rhynchospora pubera]
MEGNISRNEDQTLAATTYEEDDVEMLEALTLDDGGAVESPPRVASSSSSSAPGKNKKKKKKNRKKNKAANGSNIANINRFVLDTCKRLKERKSYLVWNAVACVGVSAVSDLVKEVEAIEKCGGQMTVDGKRLRTGGGVLWNIIKTREPKAYKEIMLKGKEFEKKLRNPRAKQEMMKGKNEETSSQSSTIVPEEEIELLDVHEPLASDVGPHEEEMPTEAVTERKSIRERIRVPVCYDDLFEEGEIHD